MTTEDGVRTVLTRAGYTVFGDAFDRGVLRVAKPPIAPPALNLAGMVVIRDELVTYAEHLGRVFPFWRTEDYRACLDAFYAYVKANPA